MHQETKRGYQTRGKRLPTVLSLSLIKPHKMSLLDYLLHGCGEPVDNRPAWVEAVLNDERVHYVLKNTHKNSVGRRGVMAEDLVESATFTGSKDSESIMRQVVSTEAFNRLLSENEKERRWKDMWKDGNTLRITHTWFTTEEHDDFPGITPLSQCWKLIRDVHYEHLRRNVSALDMSSLNLKNSDMVHVQRIVDTLVDMWAVHLDGITVNLSSNNFIAGEHPVLKSIICNPRVYAVLIRRTPLARDVEGMLHIFRTCPQAAGKLIFMDCIMEPCPWKEGYADLLKQLPNSEQILETNTSIYDI